MGIYVVEFTFKSVVVADSEALAAIVAEDSFREISRDVQPDVSVDIEVESDKDLPEQWDVGCIPYGGNNELRISELLNKE